MPVWQVVVEQSPLACGGAQGAPQPPQLVLVSSGVSQPSLGSPLQSPQPGAQVGLQTYVLVVVDNPQLVLPCALLQLLLQPPQWETVFSAVSQPATVLLQSPYPVSQVIPQWPPLHVAVPWVLSHTVAQLPQ